VGDFNGDGQPDIAVADLGDFGVPTVPGNVTIFVNTKDRAQPFKNDPNSYYFQFAALGTYLLDMATGDFNGDGKRDVAVLYFNIITNLFGIALLLGTGDGKLNIGPDTALPREITNPTSIAVGDFNGDGKDDIAVSNSLIVDDPKNNLVFSLYVLNGTGDDSTGEGHHAFETPVGYHVGTHVSAVAVGKLRGKDKPTDIIVANENFPGGVTLLLNNGDGTFPRPSIGYTTYFAGTNPVALVVADLNGDGILDIAAANINGDSVSVLFGHQVAGDPMHGDGTFSDTEAYVTGGFPSAIAADNFFNHRDGKLDLITSNIASNTVSVIENIGPQPSNSGGGAARLIGKVNALTSLAPSLLHDWFMVLGGAGQEPAALAGQPEAATLFDPWYPAVRPYRLHDADMFSTLLWQEIGNRSLHRRDWMCLLPARLGDLPLADWEGKHSI
jgi:hypothetical protein